MTKLIARLGVVALAALAVGGPAPSVFAAPACATVQGPVGESFPDCSNGQVWNILPPGSAGVSTFKTRSQPPPHQQDQLGMYANLKTAVPITASQLQLYYKQAGFGVAPQDVERTETPRAGTVILRDKQFGVPHIFGDTRYATEFGAGYAAAEDRLFLMDTLRHVGRATVASFLGPSQQTLALDCSMVHVAGYSDAEFNYMVNLLPQRYTARFDATHTDGEQVVEDGRAFIDGINEYIHEAEQPQNLDSMMPVEYGALQQVPTDWVPSDIVAVATLVESIFAVGGGGEVDSALLYQALKGKFGADRAFQIWHDLRRQNDPEAQTTLTQSFPYETEFEDATKPGASAALPDSQPVDHSCEPLVPIPDKSSFSPPSLAIVKHSMSNALLVSGEHTTTGHPIAVFGPQVSYFAPEILHEEELNGPNIHARGATFPGTDVYVELGHGVDYAWSATSAGSDQVDQHLEILCDPATGTPIGPEQDSTSYLYRGACLPMYERTDFEFAKPTAAGTAPTPIIKKQIERTIHGPVVGRTTAVYNGEPVRVAISSQRSTWFDELGSAPAFLDWNNPNFMHGAHDFMRAAAKESGTFNWFYADSKDIAYYSSGQLPQRLSTVDPNFPTWGDGSAEWQGFSPVGCNVPGDTPLQPTTTRCGYTAAWLRADGSAGDPHPHTINPPQGFLANWNNKPAADWAAADDNFGYGPVYRSQSLSERLKRSIAAGPVTPVDVVNDMADAGSVDLHGSRLVPPLLALLRQPGVTESRELKILDDWAAGGAGAYRREARSDPYGPYLQGNAVAIMDTLYPHLVHAVFDPWFGNDFGSGIYPAAFKIKALEDPPGPKGSAYDESSGGWEGYLYRIFLQARGADAFPYSQQYCGATRNPDASVTPGTLDSCRAALNAALQATIADLASAYGSSNPDDWTCDPHNDASKGQCNPQTDYIQFSAVGVEKVPNIPWINRPTFQQVVQFPTSRAEQPAGAVEAQTATQQPGLPGTGAPAQRQPTGGPGLWLPGALAAGALLLVTRPSIAAFAFRKTRSRPR